MASNSDCDPHNDSTGILSLLAHSIRETIGCENVRIFQISAANEWTLAHGESARDDNPDETESSTRDLNLWIGHALSKGQQQHFSKQDLQEKYRVASAVPSPTLPRQALLWSPICGEMVEQPMGVLELRAPAACEAFSQSQREKANSIAVQLGKVLPWVTKPPCQEGIEEIYRAWRKIEALRTRQAFTPVLDASPPGDNQVSRVDEEKMMGLARLAAGIAHEINNPLAVASANIGQFREICEEIDVVFRQVGSFLQTGAWEEASNKLQNPELISLLEDSREMAAETKEALGRIAKVVSQMMKFGDQNTEKMEEIDLSEEAKRAVARFRQRTASDSKAHSQIHVDCQMSVKFWAPKEQIRQILMELLENATQAAEHKRAQGEVRVRVSRDDEQAVVEIEDNGPGIDFDKQRDIFDPFYTTKQNWCSTGLGLAAVYGIVKSMNGSISLQSSPGNGALFRICLPMQGNNDPERKDTTDSSAKSGRYYEDFR